MTGDVIRAVQTASTRYQQLVICTAREPEKTSNLFTMIAEQTAWPLLNVSLELSQALLNFSIQQRKRQVVRLFEDLIRHQQTKTLLLNHIELLFEYSLGLDPVSMLGNGARHRILVVNWPGIKTEQTLSYATPTHPEYRSYKLSQLEDIIFVDDLSL